MDENIDGDNEIMSIVGEVGANEIDKAQETKKYGTVNNNVTSKS